MAFLSRRVAVAGVALVLAATPALAACGGEPELQRRSAAAARRSRCCCPSPRPRATRPSTSPSSRRRSRSSAADCKVDYYNADQDSAKQAQQVDTALGKGAKVLVLDPVDGKAAAGVRQRRARRPRRRSIAYDRFIEGADYYMSFDNETVGKLQAEALVKAMGDKGNILMLNGSPTRPERRAVQEGRPQRHRQLGASRSSRAGSTTTPTGAPTTPRSSSPPSSASTRARSTASTPPTTTRPAASIAALTGCRSTRPTRPAPDHRPGRLDPAASSASSPASRR